MSAQYKVLEEYVMTAEPTIQHRALRFALLDANTDRADLIQRWIQQDTAHCAVFHNVIDLQQALNAARFDGVIVDLDVCGEARGHELLGWIRKTLDEHMRVIVTSSSNEERVAVSAIYAGADTFLPNPLRRNELSARLHVLLKQIKPQPDNVTCAPYEIDLCNRQIRFKDEPIVLTNREYELAVYLFQNRGKILSRELLLSVVWSRSAMVNTRTVDTHISRLRHKLRVIEAEHWSLSAVYQRGYLLKQQVVRA